MRKLATILFMATLSLVGVVSSGWGQQPVPPSDLLTPGVERVATRATLLYLGMPEAEVARAMGAPTTVVAHESDGVQLRVLRFAPEPLPIKVTLSDGKISAVAHQILNGG